MLFICLSRRVGVSRMAFYRNYQSKNDIVAEDMRALYVDYTKKLEHEGSTLYMDYAVNFFTYIATNERFMRKALDAGYVSASCKEQWTLL